jgi:thioredoxin-like negative regulator of GroEL
VEAELAPPAPAAEAATPEPAPPDIAARYATAERLMIIDPAAARAALNALVAEAPRAPEAAQATLDIARLATRAGDLHAARAALDQLPALPGGPALARPAAYLRCVLEQDPMPLAGCLMSFRAAYPESPNDAEVLARLAVVVANTGDCQAARPLLVEYRRLYPTGPSAATLQTWSDNCARNVH